MLLLLLLLAVVAAAVVVVVAVFVIVEGRAGETDFWLGRPTRRLPKPAHVLSNNPDSLALGLVLLAYSIGLVRTVRDGQATCYVCGPQNSGTDMPSYLYR